MRAASGTVTYARNLTVRCPAGLRRDLKALASRWGRFGEGCAHLEHFQEMMKRALCANVSGVFDSSRQRLG